MLGFGVSVRIEEYELLSRSATLHRQLAIIQGEIHHRSGRETHFSTDCSVMDQNAVQQQDMLHFEYLAWPR